MSSISQLKWLMIVSDFTGPCAYQATVKIKLKSLIATNHYMKAALL